MAAVLLLAAAAGLGCSGDTEPARRSPYLVRVGTDAVSVVDYEKALELARSAYPHSVLQEPETDRAIRMRVLRELTEELIFRQRARELMLSVTEDEIRLAEESIRADYPGNEFEKVILENAVSYQAWKEKLKLRLLMEKLVKEDLESRLEISAGDVAAYVQAHGSELAPDLEAEGGSPDRNADERIVDELRRKKAEEAYAGWIEKLQEMYPIDINLAQWQRIAGS